MKFIDTLERSQLRIAVGAVLLLLLSSGLFYLIITGKTRIDASPVTPLITEASSTVKLVARRLDGVLVSMGEEALQPHAVMIDNEINARPLSGLSKANMVIEAPVEGGVTRFMAFFDPTSTVAEIGPIRSARPYFVDWVKAWNALYFHVGGSPEALKQLASSSPIFDVDEIPRGRFFWRSGDRFMPHNTYTNSRLMDQASMEFASSTAPLAWHFQDEATSSTRKLGGVLSVKVTYGGPYTVLWKFDQTQNRYRRYQTGAPSSDVDGTAIESENVIVMKTDARVLDDVGRLHVRTIGSGDALAYRDGNKYTIRWRRSAGEPIKFESKDGKEFLFNRGRTWIEVTIDDRMFAGLEK